MREADLDQKREIIFLVKKFLEIAEDPGTTLGDIDAHSAETLPATISITPTLGESPLR
jgi:hypothetical protein